MSSDDLERRWLSLRYWLLRCVLPSVCILVLILLVLRWISDNPAVLNHNAVIVGFFTLYFILVRGGHMLMIRSLNTELKQTFGPAYEARLANWPAKTMRRRNIGFTLAQIKRDLNAEQQGRSSR